MAVRLVPPLHTSRQTDQLPSSHKRDTLKWTWWGSSQQPSKSLVKVLGKLRSVVGGGSWGKLIRDIIYERLISPRVGGTTAGSAQFPCKWDYSWFWTSPVQVGLQLVLISFRERGTTGGSAQSWSSWDYSWFWSVPVQLGLQLILLWSLVDNRHWHACHDPTIRQECSSAYECFKYDYGLKRLSD